jgi:hypothetical protein
MAKNTLKNLKKKMKKQAKRFAGEAKKQTVSGLKKAHIGKVLGEAAKQALGQALASGVGAYGRGAYGRGSYSTGEPAVVNSLFNEYPNRRHRTREIGDETGRTRVSRREYVMRVTAPNTSIEFNNTSFAINPGMRGVFAWLSQIAANYDEYELEHLVFHYKPVISQASTSGAMGSVLLSCNYNAGADKFASFREMAEYMGTLETRVCDEAYFGVECDPTKHGSQQIEFIRTGSVPSGQDIKTYDLGLFQIATSDVASFTEGTLLGHLYVEYSVVLGKPKLYTALGRGIMQDMFRSVTGVTRTAPFGTTAGLIPHPSNTIGVMLSGSSGVGTFPDNFYGRAMIIYHASGSVAIQPNTIDVAGNVTKVAILTQNGNQGLEVTSDGLAITMQIIVDVTAASGGVENTFTVVLDAGTINGMNLDICQCNPGFASADW